MWERYVAVSRPGRYRFNISAIMAAAAGLLLVVMFVALTMLPPLHPQLLELDPLHGHVVLGGTPANQARVLAAHLRGSADHPATHSEQADTPCDESHAAEVHILSIWGGGPTGTMVFSLRGVVAASPGAFQPPALTVGRLTMPLERTTQLFMLAVPEPPPRAT